MHHEHDSRGGDHVPTRNRELAGGIKTGNGTVASDAGALADAAYSFGTRFENCEAGTNREELLAAAHAARYSMALSLVLGEAGITPEQVRANASVNVEANNGGFAINAVRLDVHARVPGAGKEAVEQAVATAKDACPVSKLFNAEITLETHVES